MASWRWWLDYVWGRMWRDVDFYMYLVLWPSSIHVPATVAAKTEEDAAMAKRMARSRIMWRVD